MRFFIFDQKTYNAKAGFKAQLVAGMVSVSFLVIYYAIVSIIGLVVASNIAPGLFLGTPRIPVQFILRLPEPTLHVLAIIGIILLIFSYVLGIVIARTLYIYTFIRLYRKYTNQ